MGSISTVGNKTFNIFISSLWSGKSNQHIIPPEGSILTLGSQVSPSAYPTKCRIQLKIYIYVFYTLLASRCNTYIKVIRRKLVWRHSALLLLPIPDIACIKWRNSNSQFINNHINITNNALSKTKVNKNII